MTSKRRLYFLSATRGLSGPSVRRAVRRVRRSATFRAMIGRLVLVAVLIVPFVGCSQGEPVAAFAGGTGAAGSGDPINLLLISLDSVRADHLGSYGYPRETSPHIDALAAEGVVFESTVSETSWTLPTHVTLLTGLSSRVHRVTWHYRAMGNSLTTLAEALRGEGYRTEGFVSGPFLHRIFGLGRGFDRYELIGESVYDEPGVTLGQVRETPELQAKRKRQNDQFQTIRSSPELVRRFEQSLARAANDPFFIFVHMFDPHYDYDPPEAYWRPFNPDYAGDFDASGFIDNKSVRRSMSSEDHQQLLALYDGEIRWTDEHIGKMLDLLERYGVAERTLVVVTADHGDEFFEHGNKGHRQTLFDDQLLVPLVLRLPGVLPAGRRLRMQTRTSDIMPTLLDLLGARSEVSTSGRSLVPFIHGDLEEQDLPALSLLQHRGRIVRALRTSEGKLITTRSRGAANPQADAAAFYDLPNDPGEQRPLTDGRQFDAFQAELDRLSREEQELRTRLDLEPAGKLALPTGVRKALEVLGYIDGEDSTEPD